VVEHPDGGEKEEQYSQYADSVLFTVRFLTPVFLMGWLGAAVGDAAGKKSEAADTEGTAVMDMPAGLDHGR
jgi:hypothetical protein